MSYNKFLLQADYIGVCDSVPHFNPLDLFKGSDGNHAWNML